MTHTHELTNRLKKKILHLKKWTKKENLSCYRLYDKDLPNYPAIVEWYDGEVVTWIYRRKKDETEDKSKSIKVLRANNISLGGHLNFKEVKYISNELKKH